MEEKMSKIDFNKSQALAVTTDGSVVGMSRDAGIPDKATAITIEPSWFGDDTITVVATEKMTADQASAVWEIIREATKAFCAATSGKDAKVGFAEYKLSAGDSVKLSFPKGSFSDEAKKDIIGKAKTWVENHAEKPADTKAAPAGTKTAPADDDPDDTDPAGKKPAKKPADKKPADKSPTDQAMAAVAGKTRGSDDYNAALAAWADSFLDS